MKSFNKTAALLFVAVVSVLAALGAYSFIFITMKNKTEATSELLSKTAELSGKETRMASAAAALKNESANIEKLSTYFIKESEIVSFAKKIEELGTQSGTDLSLEALDPGVTEKTIPFLDFRIRATGEFVNIQRLLVLLENFPGKFEWKTVRLVREASSGQVSGTGTSKTVSQIPMWKLEVFLTARNFIKE